jgi:hypothetical protein
MHTTTLWAFTTIVLFALQTAVAAEPVTFFVAPDGDDNAAGTMEKPFRTPAHARDAVRKAKRPDSPATVYLRGGSYFLAEPLVLTPEDSGTEKGPVTWAAHGDEKPVLSGGRAVTGWAKKQLDGKEVWAAAVKLPEKTGPLRSLWVNGRRAVRARHPNAGYFTIDAVPEATSEWMKGVTSFKFTGDDLKAWPGLSDGGEVIAMSRWVESRLPVKQVDEAGKIVRFGKPTVFTIEKGDRYWVEGTPALLDAPGEWHYDASSSTLYYLPRPGEEMGAAQGVIPAMSQVLRIEGKPDADKTVDHVTFRGLTFSHTDWGAGWSGADPQRSGFNQAAVGVPAAVHADGARHVTFDHCTVAHVGTYGLALARGCRDNRVTHCAFTDLGAGAVKLGETALRDSERDQTGRNEVSDCRLTDGGNLFPSAVGLWIGQSFDNRISHNEIADFYYTAISVGWTWGYGKSLAKGNVVEHNHVHHIGKPSDDEHAPILSDMGGIYTLGIQPGTVVRNNRFHDIAAIKYGGWGIYFDEGTSNAVAENNVVYRTTHGGFHQHYGKDNVFRNNILALGRDAQVQRTRPESHRSFTFERNIVYWTRGELTAGSWESRNVGFDYNVYWKPEGEKGLRAGGLPWTEWRAAGFDQHSVVADPKFADLKGDNYNLASDSPALAVGFTPFNQSDVGPRK